MKIRELCATLKVFIALLKEAFNICADDREIHNIDAYFDNSYEDEWFEDETVKSIVRDIDKTEIVGPHVAISPVLGSIPVTGISGGAKVLILMLKRPEILHPGDSCGDNCAEWICKMLWGESMQV